MSLKNIRNLQHNLKKIIPGNYIYHLEEVNNIFDIDLDTEEFLKLDKDQMHIMDFSDEPWGSNMAIQVESACRRSHLKKYLILSHSLDFYKNPSWPNIVYFPHNYYDPVMYWNERESLEFAKLNKRKYFLSCLNRAPRFSRIYNFLKFKQREGYLGRVKFTMHDLHNTPYHADDYKAELSPEMATEWERLKRALPKHCANDLNIVDDAYWDTYINLVTETNVFLGNNFFSEKIFKPIASGQFFLAISNPGTIQILRDMGFDTYDDVIDHYHYDSIADWDKRIDAVHELIDDLYFYDWEEIYKKTYKRRIANIKLFYSGEPVKKYGIDLAERMSLISGEEFKYTNLPLKDVLLEPFNFKRKLEKIAKVWRN